MAGNLLNIGKTGLYAAQAGLATTGHNIANANTIGYSRQTTIQASMPAQNVGNGFIGSGTQVADIQRYSDPFLNSQVRGAQSAASALSAYSAQIGQLDNLLADTSSGLSPALQDFFKSVQDLTANAGSATSRQGFLASGESLAARFQGINGRLEEMRGGVNNEIGTKVDMVNAYATQIAKLNDQIGALAGATGHAPNDLLDARDQLVLDLNKQIKATAVAGANSTVTVSIGSGQPLVVGNRAFQLSATSSAGDPTRSGIGYVTAGGVTPLADSTFSGGELGGLLDFRSTTLDQAQNALGRIAIGMAASYNAQNRLGIDSAGNPGGKLFSLAAPRVSANLNPAAPKPDPAAVPPVVPAALAVTLGDAAMLSTSDYTVAYDAAKSLYNVTRLSDRTVTAIAYSAPGPASQNIDGLDFTFSGAAVDGDHFQVRPTIDGAAQFNVAALDSGAIAAAAPVLTVPATTNRGSAVVSEGSVDKDFLLPGNVFAPATLRFDAAANTLSGFANGQAVKVTDAAGAAHSYVAGSEPIPYAAGSTYTFGGVSIAFKGQPIDGDQFSVARNTGGGRDNRNMLQLGALQSTPLFDKGTTTYQGAFAQLVGTVGNKAREVQVNSAASETMLAQASVAQQSVSGVNLDEEAANLLKYQQAYQAAGKLMQIAGTLFDTLLSLGR